MKKITVLYGNYGSGKTELSLNMALKAKQSIDKVTLVDLDVVNPYFRSSEHKSMLEDKGIKVIAPVYANTAVDLPTIPPDVYTAFSSDAAIFDCGGDAAGATALGSLKSHFDQSEGNTQILFVVNTCRPFQTDISEIEDSLRRIETNARLKADGFVLNTNIGKDTTGGELAQGYELLYPLSQKLDIPISIVSGTENSINVFKNSGIEYNGDFFILTPMMRPDWMENS